MNETFIVKSDLTSNRLTGANNEKGYFLINHWDVEQDNKPAFGYV